MDDLEKLAELLRTRNTIDNEIAQVIGRPALAGHTGEYIASKIFEIALSSEATNAGFDGHFTRPPHQGKTVNIKWYGKNQNLLDIGEHRPDFYLVLTGPKATARSSRGTIRPAVIDSIFLFEAAELLRGLQQSTHPVRIGTATSLRAEYWVGAMIYPAENPSFPLSKSQRDQLALFRSSPPAS